MYSIAGQMQKYMFITFKDQHKSMLVFYNNMLPITRTLFLFPAIVFTLLTCVYMLFVCKLYALTAN